MAKHIHIHLHRTTDADGPAHAPVGFSNGGQFVTSGSSGGNVSHHEKQMKFHGNKAAELGEAHSDYGAHRSASVEHQQAAMRLKQAKKGNKEAELASAQHHANRAASHEAKIKTNQQ